MEPIFQIKNPFDANATKEACRIADRYKRRPLKGSIISAFVFAAFVLNVIDGDALPVSVYCVILFLICVALTLFLPDLRARGIIRQNKKDALLFNEEPLINFTEDDIEIPSRLTEVKLNYNVVFNIIESSGVFLLYVDKKKAFLLPKDGLTTGTADDLRCFLQQKTGKTEVRVNCLSTKTRILLFAVAVALATLTYCLFFFFK